MLSLDEIWEGDLFKRRAEAVQLLGFIKTVTMRPSLREDGHAYVLAVDAPYGEGKSFFLRRFARHVAHSHPVAFVDAWTDDLEDEPLVALAATLDEALTPLADRSEEFKKKVGDFKRKATEVTKIVGAGLVKRLLSLAILESGAEALASSLSSTNDGRDLAQDVIKDGVTEAADNAVKAASAIVAGNMDERIKRFREGRQAIDEMKASLQSIVVHLQEEDIYPPPIVIIIDELDRCRPNYAIKLLEEIKHLFDVQGVAFVLGMHGKALAHSVSATYGANFDGEAYLRRFFNRTYQLNPATLDDLIAHLFVERNIDPARLRSPSLNYIQEGITVKDPNRVIAMYMQLYEFNAREAFAVVDAIETALALTEKSVLYLPLFLPMLFDHLRNQKLVPLQERLTTWVLAEHDRNGKFHRDLNPINYFEQLLAYTLQNDQQLMKAVNGDNPPLPASIVAGLTFNNQNSANSLGIPRGYKRLLRTVDSFTTDGPRST